MLESLNQNKAAGPSGVRVPKTRADQLHGILQQPFKVRKSCSVEQFLSGSATKELSLSALNDYRPVVFSSYNMKVPERLGVTHLGPQVSTSLDPTNFAYCA